MKIWRKHGHADQCREPEQRVEPKEPADDETGDRPLVTIAQAGWDNEPADGEKQHDAEFAKIEFVRQRVDDGVARRAEVGAALDEDEVKPDDGQGGHATQPVQVVEPGPTG